jgi:uncharacterized protein (DUF362 family)
MQIVRPLHLQLPRCTLFLSSLTGIRQIMEPIMSSAISRRSFLRNTISTGGLLIAGSDLAGICAKAGESFLADTYPDLAAVTGNNSYESTIKAVGLLGGMSRFVARGSRVGLLINSKFRNKGSYVKPQIALAAVAMLREAGAKEIVSLEDADSSYWKRATLTKDHLDLVKEIVGPAGSTTITLKNARRLKEIEICRDYLECDALLNIAIFKDHSGTRFTGALKNIMGATRGDTNQYWHLGSGSSDYYGDVKFLSGCIADGNLCRKPTLCIGDATEVLIQHGPFGPGPTKDFNTVVAGTNPVSFDAFGSTILGFKQDQMVMVRAAADLGIGTCALESIRIERESV